MTGRARALGNFTSGLVVVTYGLLVFGASVRVHGAGLARKVARLEPLAVIKG